MDTTELAHWRYRVKAIEQESQDARSEQIAVNNYWPYVNDKTNEWFSAVLQASQEKVALIHWLLEEANYMAELGAITAEEHQETPAERLQQIVKRFW